MLNKIRHTSAHVLAMAVLRLWPDTKLGIGPAIKDGFYYDFEFGHDISEEDLTKLEEEMQKIIQEDMPVYQIKKSKEEALKFYKKWDQPYKRQLVKDLEDETLTFYVIGDEKTGFVDLCKGPHVESTGQIGAVKLLKIAGAYWKGDEKKPMLTRIYGTAFETEEDLDNFLKLQEERKKRDHRELNKKLKYYHIDPELVGSGLPILLPRGAYIRRKLEEWILELYTKTGHQLVYTPHVAKDKLWYTSGHLPYYEDSMFPKMQTKEEDIYYVKAMNCPLHIQVYKRMVLSYKELPFRVTDMATVYRYEKSGELSGLTRVRSLTQDDGHIFCREDQILEEVTMLLKLAQEIYSVLGFTKVDVDLSIRGDKQKDKYLGDDSLWDKAETMLEDAIKEIGLDYSKKEGEAAFYGPKIDFHVTDTVGRKWQVATIQLDFNLPQRFELKYIAEDGKEYVPVMIHRAILGSFERFMGTLIENFGGAMPLWLESEKVRILPINNDVLDYSKEVLSLLLTEGIESTVDTKDEPLGAKIRRAEESKVPYVVIIGPKEKETGTLAIRVRGHGDVGLVKPEEFIEKLTDEIKRKIKKSVFLQ